MYFIKIPCNLVVYFWYTKLVYLKSAKLEQLILHFNCAEVVLKSNYRNTLVYLIVKVELLQVYFSKL